MVVALWEPIFPPQIFQVLLKFLPGRGFTTLWGCRHAAPLEDIAHGLVTDLVAQLRQGTSQTVITPAPIFLGHLDNQVFQFVLNTGTSRRLALGGAIAFVRGEFSLPGKDGVRFDDMGDFFQGFLPELSAELRQGLALGIAQVQSSCDLMAQDAVFGCEILVTEQQFFIDRAGNISQQRLPIHVALPPHASLHLTMSIAHEEVRYQQRTGCARAA